MQNSVNFIGADSQGIISNETWQATTMFCPKCGQNHKNVWVLTSEPPLQAGNHVVRTFMCVACRCVVVLNAFKPVWDVSARAQQIIQLAFNQPEAAE